MIHHKYAVQTTRLQNARTAFWLKRLFFRLVSYTITFSSYLFLRFFDKKCATRISTPLDTSLKIVLNGRFESHNWLNAHVKPIASSKFCEKIWVITDKALRPIPNVTYIIPNKLLKTILGNTLARALYCFHTSYRNNVNIVGGFHLLTNGIIAILVARIIGAKSLYFCVGGWSEILGGGSYSGTPCFGSTGIDDKLLQKYLLKIIRRCDLTVVMGSKAKMFFKEMDIVNVEIIQGGLEPPQTLPFVTKEYQKPFDLVLVARLDPIKRVDRFLQIVQSVSNTIPDIKALIVGDGPIRNELEMLVQELKIQNSTTFVGFKDDIPTWLDKSKLFLLTSDSEGLPLSCMEAIISGLPVIASKVGDLEDLITDGVNGYLVAPNDLNKFIQIIVYLLSNNSARFTLSKGCFESSTFYHFDVVVKRWDNILKNLAITHTI